MPTENHDELPEYLAREAARYGELDGEDRAAARLAGATRDLLEDFEAIVGRGLGEKILERLTAVVKEEHAKLRRELLGMLGAVAENMAALHKRNELVLELAQEVRAQLLAVDGPGTTRVSRDTDPDPLAAYLAAERAVHEREQVQSITDALRPLLKEELAGVAPLLAREIYLELSASMHERLDGFEKRLDELERGNQVEERGP